MISTAAYMRVVTRKGMLPICYLRSETDPIKSEQIYVDDNFLWKAGGFHYQKTAHLSLHVSTGCLSPGTNACIYYWFCSTVPIETI